MLWLFVSVCCPFDAIKSRIMSRVLRMNKPLYATKYWMMMMCCYTRTGPNVFVCVCVRVWTNGWEDICQPAAITILFRLYKNTVVVCSVDLGPVCNNQRKRYWKIWFCPFKFVSKCTYIGCIQPICSIGYAWKWIFYFASLLHLRLNRFVHCKNTISYGILLFTWTTVICSMFLIRYICHRERERDEEIILVWASYFPVR